MSALRVFLAVKLAGVMVVVEESDSWTHCALTSKFGVTRKEFTYARWERMEMSQ
jgi:hypothetical protein